MSESPKIIVCQHGSRHRYAIPRMLESQGMLEALYLDSSSESLMGKLVQSRGLGGHDRWAIKEIPPSRIRSSDLPHAYEFLAKRFSGKPSIHLYHRRHKILSWRMKQWGTGSANMVYSMYHENLDFVRFAKKRGLRSAVDVFISPLTEEIMKEEAALFPDWGYVSDAESDRLSNELWKETAALADVLLCPSEWVAEGVRSATPAAANKIRVVPYGSSFDYGGRVNEPVRGRILFAGRDPLRKGVQYLARAADRLKDVPEVDIRIAGGVPEAVRSHPSCANLNFLGQLDRAAMVEEFLSADAFVLPALSEGFASVVAEAIGAGCPVIVTKEAGSPVVNEREGLVVPSRDDVALAEAIASMVSNRALRDRCAAGCGLQSAFYSEEQWRARLIDALRTSEPWESE